MDPAALALLRCPRTGGPVVQADACTLASADGSQRWPVVHGIPDFRLFDPPYMSRAEEVRIVDALAAVADAHDYAGLVRHYVLEVEPGLGEAQRRRDLEHRTTLATRSPRRLDELLAKGETQVPAEGWTLDLGCGSGEALVALAGRARGVVGIDISLVELFLAQKQLAERGRSALLVAGCAEALPVASGRFAFVYSPDVIEHVSDQQAYFAEAWRVLEPGGVLLLNSPNRYSLVCPEPHVGIWGLTFLPRPLIDPVSRLLGGGPYTGKRLVSLPELRRLVGAHFSDHRISARPANPEASGLLGRLYRDLAPLSTGAFAYVDAQHVVRARKSAGVGT